MSKNIHVFALQILLVRKHEIFQFTAQHEFCIQDVKKAIQNTICLYGHFFQPLKLFGIFMTFISAINCGKLNQALKIFNLMNYFSSKILKSN